MTPDIRTELHCHNCSKNFIAELHADIDGKHVIECPHCGHEHYRHIKDGAVTHQRWGSDNSGKTVPAKCVWKSSVIKAQTSSVANHIRERWLERSDYDP